MKKSNDAMFKIQRYYCDCNKEVQCSGETTMSDPPKYIHYCVSCDKKYELDKVYPRIFVEEN